MPFTKSTHCNLNENVQRNKYHVQKNIKTQYAVREATDNITLHIELSSVPVYLKL